MSTYRAQTVVITYADGSVDTYVDIDVQQVVTEPKGGRPGSVVYASMNLPIERLVDRRLPAPAPAPAPTPAPAAEPEPHDEEPAA